MNLLKSLMVLGLLIYHSYSYTCSYRAEGLNKDNIDNFTSAMKTISPEVNVDMTKGEVSFHSKKAVTVKQVKKALKNSGLKNITIHKGEHKNSHS